MKCSGIIILFCLLVFVRCTEHKKESTIRLKWNAYGKEEKAADVQRGLSWALSLLGAEIGKEKEAQLLAIKDSCYVVLQMDSLGFTQEARDALLLICDSLKKSEEYQRNAAIDLGRFLVLTLHSPKHYYKITGAPSFANYAKRIREMSADSFLVKKSCVSYTERKIIFSDKSEVQNMIFTAIENAEQARKPFLEVFDVMNNGQFRFWMYDEKRQLADFSPTTFGTAGSPSKCSWCHESFMQTLRSPTPDIAPYMLSTVFNARMDSVQKRLEAYRAKKKLATHFEQYQDHTLAELLYISFMEPSAYRLSKEWGIPEETVKQRMKNCTTHRHTEFDFLGDLYDRKDADKCAPFNVCRVPESVRENSSFQPDYFK